MRDFLKISRDFFATRHWIEASCVHCGKHFFTKLRTDNCQSFECLGRYAFPDVPPPKSVTTTEDAAVLLVRFLTHNGFPKVDPVTLIREDERTLFASTAGHVYDAFIYSDH